MDGSFVPEPLACNPHGIVQAGVHSLLLDACMNFAINAALPGRDRTRATLELKTETMRPARKGEAYKLRGEVVRMARQVAYGEATVRDPDGELASRATATFLLQTSRRGNRPGDVGPRLARAMPNPASHRRLRSRVAAVARRGRRRRGAAHDEAVRSRGGPWPPRCPQSTAGRPTVCHRARRLPARSRTRGLRVVRSRAPIGGWGVRRLPRPDPNSGSADVLLRGGDRHVGWASVPGSSDQHLSGARAIPHGAARLQGRARGRRPATVRGHACRLVAPLHARARRLRRIVGGAAHSIGWSSSRFVAPRQATARRPAPPGGWSETE